MADTLDDRGVLQQQQHLDQKPLLQTPEYNHDSNSKTSIAKREIETTDGDMKVLTFDQAMKKAGGLGIFQIYITFMIAVIYVSNGYIFYALTYLELWPDYKCAKGIPDKECNRDLMCKNPDNEALIHINWESTHSLHNWVEKLSLICEPSWKIGMIGSMYLFGWSAGCLFVPRLGDLYGRKIPYAISTAASILCYLGLILSNSINLTMAMFFLLGLSTPGKSNIAYVYLLELVPTHWQTYVGTAMLFADGSTMIFLSLYFRFISKEWLGFQLYGIIASTVAFLGSLLAPESPKYLYSYKKFREARNSLQFIARINKIPILQRQAKYMFDTEVQEIEKNRKSIPILSGSPSWLEKQQNSNENGEIQEDHHQNSKQNTLDQINRSEDRTPDHLSKKESDITKEEEVEATGSLKELIKDKRHLQNLLLLLFLWVASAFDYYLINFQLKYIEGDIYTNTIVSSVSEVTAYLVSGALYEKIGTKVSFIGSFAIAVVGSIFLITLGGTNKELIPVMILGSKFGISGSFNVVYLANGLFPPMYSSTTFGLCNFFARLASMLAPQFAEWPAPTPMIIFCAMSIAAGITSFFLQTESPAKNKKTFKSKHVSHQKLLTEE